MSGRSSFSRWERQRWNLQAVAAVCYMPLLLKPEALRQAQEPQVAKLKSSSQSKLCYEAPVKICRSGDHCHRRFCSYMIQQQAALVGPRMLQTELSLHIVPIGNMD